MGELKKWLKQDWVRIGPDGSILGKCGTSKTKRILIDVYQELKLANFQKHREQQLHKRKKLLEKEVKQ